ncbi:MAG: carotenoid biosynthesis protein [Acidobacteriota bacterium]|nr:carotenoid biosynthesis protein [Acidobacteriota bacterium]
MLIALWALYSILWIGGVGAHLLFGGTPANTSWAAPAYLSLAGLIVIVSAPSDSRALGIAAGAGFCSEVIGVHLGIPFGHYLYTPALYGFVFGVPIVLLFAWMVLIAFVRQLRWKALSSAAFMVVIDLVIDPVASRTLAYWQWVSKGDYYGVPVLNFAGWFAVSAFIFAVTPGLAPPSRSVKLTGISIILFFSIIGLIHGLYLPGVIGFLLIAICVFCYRAEFTPAGSRDY